MQDLDVEIRPLETKHFGKTTPQGSKVVALSIPAPNEPVVFFDTDTLFTGLIDQISFDLDYPPAWMARSAALWHGYHYRHFLGIGSSAATHKTFATGFLL